MTISPPNRTRSVEVTGFSCSACALRTDPAGRSAHQTGRVALRSPRRDFPGQAEVDVLARHLDLLELVVAERGQAAQNERDQLLGSRCAGGEADRLVPSQEVGIETALALDQKRLGTFALRNLDEAPRV